MAKTQSETSTLCLADIATPLGVDLSEVLVIRHAFRPDGLVGPNDVTPERVLDYTREQDSSPRSFPSSPPPTWLVFVADGGTRARFFGTFHNGGELLDLRTEATRTFDLHAAETLALMAGRLVIEWPSPRSWHRRGLSAAAFPVVEIADPEAKRFPGYDHVLLTYDELRIALTDSRYASWRTALGAVQGIYLITDTSTGQHYVGKADGAERLLGRWSVYARDGHGGNVALRELAGLDATHARHFLFSVLRVFGPSTSASEVDAAETHYKRALLTRKHGLNRN